MALELRPGKSKWWYGRVKVNGRRFAKNLGVEVRGAVPLSLSEQGDIAFERSRAKAQAALEKLQLDLKKRSTAEELVQTIHEILTGARVSSIPLDEIGARWKALPRRRPLSDSYVTASGELDHAVREIRKGRQQRAPGNVAGAIEPLPQFSQGGGRTRGHCQDLQQYADFPARGVSRAA